MVARRTPLPGLGKAELSVADQLARLEARIAQLEATPTTPQVQTSNFAAKEGQFVIVEAPPEGISALLPQARAQNRNRRITFNAKNSNPIRLLSVNGLVNNQSSVVSTSPGTFDAVSDGATGWFITSQAASAAGGTNNATYLLETADASLPNARVGTDSAEVDVDYTVASAVSWALRASSVVFGKLQNLTGLSVLGRAANSTGVMAAITASGARQALMSDAAGTSIAWRAITTSDLPSQSADTFLGRLAGAGSPAAQNLSALASTSIVYDATSHTFQRAALTGAIAAGQNGNGAVFAGIRDNGALETPGRTNLNFLTTTSIVAVVTQDAANDELELTWERAALTGAITASQNSSTTAFGALAAKSVLANAANASAVPAALAGSAAFQYLRVNSGNTGLEWATLSTHASTSILYDAATNTFQHAALTGDVTASQNSNATTIANDAVTNAKLANMAQATIKLRASGAGTGDPIDGTITQALDMASSTNGAVLTRSSAAGNIWTAIPSQGAGLHLCQDSTGAKAQWFDPSSGSGGTLSLATTGSLSVVPDNNMDIATDVGNGVGFSRNMNRCIWWDDFTVVQGLNIPAGFTYITCETGWVCTNNTAATTGNVSCFDGGAAGTATAPGELNIATNATTGTQLDFHKGLNNTTRPFRASDIRSIKFKAKLTSTASVHVTLGLNDRSFGSLDCARFDYDSSVAANWHVISANSGGATLNNADTLVAATTNYVEFEIRSPSQASANWEYYMDGVLKATHATTSKSRGVNLHFSIVNLIAANKDLRIDYVSFETWPVR